MIESSPSEKKFVVSLDQGTTSSRTVIVDDGGHIVNISQREFTQHYPQAGWVEHDPMEIYATQSATLVEAINKAGIGSDEIAAIGITNQRETTIVWNKETGKPVYNAIVWQCRRTADMCKRLEKSIDYEYLREATGLVLDPYFSATKVKWILDNVDGARFDAESGKLLFGTVDTWLMWNMTQGRVHATDYSNASRTLLFNINTREWDQRLLDAFDIPLSMMPEVKPSSSYYGKTNIGGKGGTRIPITGVAGDQQAALFGQLCVEPGQAKNTYGTGCFLLMNTGQTKVTSQHGLLTTMVCDAKGNPCYGLEGSVFMAGASIQWLRDELKLIRRAEESEQMAKSVESSNGVYVVPAFTGLGAPYWDAYARGTIVGLSRGSTDLHIVRATLESIAYQTRDVIDAMQADSGIHLNSLRVDGGAVQNSFLMQFQADLLNIDIERPAVTEVTALGTAYLAGLAIGFWDSIDDLKGQYQLAHQFVADNDEEKRCRRYAGWLRAVKCARVWAETEYET